MPLTEVAIKSLKPQDKEIKVSDAGGLYLLIHPNGGKYWRLKYRYAGKEKKLSIGTYPMVSLREARDKRDEAKRALYQGKDPGAQKQEAKRLVMFTAENNFEAIAREWFDVNKSKWTPEHAERTIRRLEIHIFPEMGPRPISDITPLELLNTIKKVEKNGTTETAHRLLQICTGIFRYAIITQRRENNPAAELKGALVPHRQEHHPTITAKELPAFFKALDKVETSRQNKIAILFTMLTMTRQGELRYAMWNDIDVSAKEWRIRPETTKMKTLHIVPLAKQSLKLLEELKGITSGNEYLFPSQQRLRHPVMSENTVNKILGEMGYKDRLVAHGFRALASTILNESNLFNKDAIERQLAHMERNQVRAAYNRAEYLDERRKMMQWWADYLDARR